MPWPHLAAQALHNEEEHCKHALVARARLQQLCVNGAQPCTQQQCAPWRTLSTFFTWLYQHSL